MAARKCCCQGQVGTRRTNQTHLVRESPYILIPVWLSKISILVHLLLYSENRSQSHLMPPDICNMDFLRLFGPGGSVKSPTCTSQSSDPRIRVNIIVHVSSGRPPEAEIQRRLSGVDFPRVEFSNFRALGGRSLMCLV